MMAVRSPVRSSLRSRFEPPALSVIALVGVLDLSLGCAPSEQDELALSVDGTQESEQPLQLASPAGVYALCRAYTNSPEVHYREGRATRIRSGSTYTYAARGSGAALTGAVTLVESAKGYFEPKASCPLPPGCQRSARQPPSGLGLRCSIDVASQGTRYFDVHVPNSYTNASAVPLVIELHGGGGAAVPPATELTSGFREVSDSSSAPYIVVWPEGSREGNGPPGAEWQTCNYDNSTPDKPCPAPGYPNDRTFVIEVLKKVVDDVKIDRRKIYATGLSSGAAMVHSLACKYSEYFAAVAPMATGMVVQQQPRLRDRFDLTVGCAPTREVPILYAHSPHDRTASFPEGAAAVRFWRQKYACSQAATQTYSSEIDRFDATDALYPSAYDLTVCRTTKCGPAADPGASSVAFCEVDGSSNLLNAYGHIIWLGDDFFYPIVQPQAPRLAQWAWDWMRPYALSADPPWPPPT
jgi:poly(3-hydroxybutyrate) depolymerase